MSKKKGGFDCPVLLSVEVASFFFSFFLQSFDTKENIEKKSVFSQTNSGDDNDRGHS